MWAGATKIFKPESLPFPWVKDNPALVLLTGIIDVLAGVGILLPAALNIRPKLTIFAAYGIIALMTAAIVFHISRGEGHDIGVNIFILLLAVFVVWGRGKGSFNKK
ncbi:integral membrane protein [Filimonas lacunae]|nr:integral membrane protein [Filimonas lacunae]